MEELVKRVAEQVGLDADTARSASAIILNFINREGPAEEVKALFAKMPDAASVLEQPPGEGGSDGGGLGGMFGGGGVMAVYQELTGAGLGMGQIQSLTKTFVEYGKEKAGEDVIGRIVGAIPGLSQFV